MIKISKNLLAEIRAHGEKTYPEECVGALLGRRGEPASVLHVERMENIRTEERARRYEISPKDYLRVEALASEKSLALLGFYHSHPDHPAAPSAYDRERAFPFFHYLVCEVAGGRGGDVTAWRLSEETGEFDREPMIEGD
ncbi:MAG TPA: M67 family metallopeptidase [Thermoanaerobaculia bacterium]|nr:M67 family metallopeptidase [Thermoanaerobaculia bacterium]